MILSTLKMLWRRMPSLGFPDDGQDRRYQKLHVYCMQLDDALGGMNGIISGGQYMDDPDAHKVGRVWKVAYRICKLHDDPPAQMFDRVIKELRGSTDDIAYVRWVAYYLRNKVQ